MKSKGRKPEAKGERSGPAINSSEAAEKPGASEPAKTPLVGTSKPTDSVLKKLLFRVAAILVGLVVACILGELMLRIFQIKPARYPPTRWLVWDGKVFRQTTIWGEGAIKRPSRFADAGVVMGEYVPGSAFKIAFATNPRGYFDEDNGVKMSVNSVGLRGEEISAEKPAGTYRILGIGDSYTFGVGVRNDDTFLHRMQTRLNTNAPAGRRYEVLNAGVQGYNTRDEAICLEYRWLALQPDLVLIFFYINDAYDDTAILNGGQELNIYAEKPHGPAQYSYVWDILQHRYQVYRKSAELEAYYHNQYFSAPRQALENSSPARMDWRVSRVAIGHIADITRQRGIKLGLVMFPELYNLKGRYPFLEMHALVKETCEQLDIPFLDLLDTFRGHDEEKLWVHPTDHHPNELGHALAAPAVESFVRQHFLDVATPPEKQAPLVK